MLLTIQQYIDVRYILSSLPAFQSALGLTLLIALAALVLSLVWGLVLVGLRMSGRRWLSIPVRAYVEVMRNTPLPLQLYIIFFGLPLIGIFLSGFLSGVLAIMAQHGAFLSETFRGAIESVSSSQRQASKALGMTQRQSLQLVILPQALLKVIPPVGNQIIMLIKDTSLVSAIGVAELTMTGNMLLDRSAASFEIFVVIAMIYLAVTSLVGMILRFVETQYRTRQ
jgi:His/Glu/Gln/Arg/opine family amino acid ABC transporter permease subunit